MRRGRDPFSPDGQDRDQNGFRTPQAHSSQPQNSFTRPDRPTGRSPGLSESVNNALKELRTMSSLNKEGGRDFQGVSDFRNSPHQPSRVHGPENSGSVQNSGSQQHPGMQPPPFASGSPFPPPLPPPPFNPSLPPPGLSPFHGPPPTLHPAHPEAMLGHPSRSEAMLGHLPGSEVMLGHLPGSNMKYDHRPPPFPQQGARPAQPVQISPRGVSMPSNSTRPPYLPHQAPGNAPVPTDPARSPHSVDMSGVAAAPNSTSHPPAPHSNFRMPGGHEGTSSGPSVYSRGSVPPPSPSHLSEGIGSAHLAFPQGPAPPHSPFRPPLPVLRQPSASSNLGKPMLGSGVPTQGDFVAPGQMPVWKTPGEEDRGSRNAGAQEEVNAWLKKMGKRTRDDAVLTDKHKTGENGALLGTESTEKQMTISEAQHRLQEVLHALAAMQGQAQQMEDMQETANTPTWKASVTKIKELKEAYLEAKEKLDMDQVKRLKRKLDQRRKKRRRQKQNRLEEKEAEQEMQFERAQKHAVIDQWRQKLQQDDRNKQQMKKMKETADRTLSKVRKEIREARKMLDTVSRLQKLRAIRSDTAEKRGQTFPPSVATHFTEKTDDLIQLITSQVQAFEKEEDALKLILQTENEEAKEKEREEKKQKEREDRRKDREEERQCLFGMLEMPGPGDPLQPYAQYYLQAQCSLQALQNIRHEWDAFVVAESTPLATRIPDGWVSPEQPSSSTWASVLLQSEPS